jgi:hypothetical protein
MAATKLPRRTYSLKNDNVKTFIIGHIAYYFQDDFNRKMKLGWNIKHRGKQKVV